MRRSTIAATIFAGSLSVAFAADLSVTGSDQDVSGGSVTASGVVAAEDGWLVVHRTDAAMKPGPVVGHAPIKAGENKDVAAKLDEPVKSGDMLMLMLHSEAGGKQAGVFEYTLGSKEDGPVRVNDKLVMVMIHAK
jgi:hypothetical protein